MMTAYMEDRMINVDQATFNKYLKSLNTSLSIKNIDSVKYYFLNKAIKAKVEKTKYYITMRS